MLRHSERMSKLIARTVITVKPIEASWSVFEAPGIQSRFGELRLAIDFAKVRANYLEGDIHILDDLGMLISVLEFVETERRN